MKLPTSTYSKTFKNKEVIDQVIKYSILNEFFF